MFRVEKMNEILCDNKFSIIDISGVIYNPLFETMSLSDYKGVNYILSAKKIENI